MNPHGSGPIMLAAGGPGGHVFPAQALAAELDRRGRAVDIVTARRGGDYSAGRQRSGQLLPFFFHFDQYCLGLLGEPRHGTLLGD